PAPELLTHRPRPGGTVPPLARRLRGEARSLLRGHDGHAGPRARVLHRARGADHVPRRLPGRAGIRGLRAPEVEPPAAPRAEPADGALDRADTPARGLAAQVR